MEALFRVPVARAGLLSDVDARGRMVQNMELDGGPARRNARLHGCHEPKSSTMLDRNPVTMR